MSSTHLLQCRTWNTQTWAIGTAPSSCFFTVSMWLQCQLVYLSACWLTQIHYYDRANNRRGQAVTTIIMLNRTAVPISLAECKCQAFAITVCLGNDLINYILSITLVCVMAFFDLQGSTTHFFTSLSTSQRPHPSKLCSTSRRALSTCDIYDVQKDLLKFGL